MPDLLWARKRPLLEKRQVAWQSMKTLMDACEAEGRSVNTDEKAQFDQWESEIDSAEADLEVIMRAEKVSSRMGQPFGLDPELLPGGDAPPPEDKAEIERRAMFVDYIKGRPVERRAYQADSDIEGGNFLAPQVVAARLIQGVKDQTFMRVISDVQPLLVAESLGVVTLDTDLGDADWTQELTQTTDDTALRVGKRELKPNPLTKEIRLSRTLVRRAPDAETLFLDRLAYRFGITNEKGFLTGTGAGQPLGVFTASADGIPTSRDVSTDNTTTAITADGLINCQMSTKVQYWNAGSWLFHRDAIKMIRKLKDSAAQYVWNPGGIGSGALAKGMPGTILDRPYYISEYAPNTFTTGLYVGLYGDFQYYWVVDALSLEVQRLEELYARTNQFGYIGRMETDAMPVLAEAFARVKLA